MRYLQILALACIPVLSSVSALSLGPRSASPKVIGLPIQKNSVDPGVYDKARLRKRAGPVTVSLDNEQTLYFADATLGTPAQTLRLHIDTGSSDLWVNSANSTLCESGKGCAGGTYSSAASSSYNFVNSDFKISYVDGTGAVGDYVSDTFTIGGATLNDFQFGVGLQSNSTESVLGIGYVSDEVQVNRAGSSAYPNLPQALVQDDVIASNAYSLWLNDLDANTGMILFGGVNSDKYHGDLATVPIIKEDGAYYEFLIALTGLAITSSSGSQSFDSSSNLPSAALLDSGTSLVYLPDDITEDVYNSVNAVYDSGSGIAYVDCALANNDSTLDFSFSGQTIQVAYSELVLDLGSLNGQPLTFKNGHAACVFGISPAGGSTPVLGDTFLRSAYVVYDLDNNEISLAQTNFNSTTDDVREITQGESGVPGATAVARPVTSLATLPGGAGNGSPTFTSNPSGQSSGAMSAFDASVAFSVISLALVGVFFSSL